MLVALRTGQPFSDILRWHPRDMETAVRILDDQRKQAEDEAAERARDERFAKMQEQMGRRG